MNSFFEPTPKQFCRNDAFPNLLEWDFGLTLHNSIYHRPFRADCDEHDPFGVRIVLIKELQSICGELKSLHGQIERHIHLLLVVLKQRIVMVALLHQTTLLFLVILLAQQ
ncbi:hypothetical protein HYZ99_04215 [Candidatus Peregrinibacteria bacterium]|nr:hypothetical protein [Candidatus Peregrinibacteria bacterium]